MRHCLEVVGPCCRGARALQLAVLSALILGATACGDDAPIEIPDQDIAGGTDQDTQLGGTDAAGDGTIAPDVIGGKDTPEGEDTADVQTTDAQTDDAQTDDAQTADAVDAQSGDAADVAADDALADADVADTSADDAVTGTDATTSDDVPPADDASTTVDAGPVACTSGADCAGDLGVCQAWTCEEGKCVAGAAVDGTTCSDGDSCTGADACVGGTCTAGANVCACQVDTDCDDGNVCTDDSCGADKVCLHANNTNGCNDGDACSINDLCLDGACTSQKTDCDDKNPCTDDSCDPTSGACINAPNQGPCQDGNACTDGDICGGGACIPGGALVCDDLNPCTDDGCFPAGGCVNLANAATCDDGDACTTTDHCEASKCASTLNACDDSNVCTADSCDQLTGGCLHDNIAVQCDDNDACTTGDTCKAGTCIPGTAKICNDGNACTTDACDPASGACITGIATGPCEDGDQCTLLDTCADGLCSPGTLKVCDDGNPCTDDTCNPVQGCVAAFNTSPCTPAGKCEIGACSAGLCKTTGQVGCDDGNPCTVDSCDPTSGCIATAVSDGTKCADGNACVTDSLCAAGKCATGTATDCNDGKPCTTDACDPIKGCTWSANTDACDDGDACTTGDVCKNGVCKGPTAVDPKVTCDDQNTCTDDSCDPAKGCVHTNNTLACDDKSLCTSGDTCAAGVCSGKATVCDDKNVCTNDSCNPATGNCVFDGNTAACDDGNACTSGDICGGGSCQAGSAKSCDDANPCTDDACDPKTGTCGYTNNTAGCDDGNPCTSGDTCAAGKCTKSTAATCDDGNGCTNDACDPATGQCTYTNNTTACDTGDKCTYGDVCGGGICVKGTSQVCNDNNVCTTDSCDAATGKCTFAAVTDGSTCDDGIACTTNACQAGKCATTASTCTLYTDPLNCADAGAGWTIVKTAGKNVVWAVDQTGTIGSTAEQAAHGCTLNYNDGTDYCDPSGNGTCSATTGTATSPTIDATAAFGVVTLQFDSWVDVDNTAQTGAETPTVTLVDATSGATLATFQVSNTAANSQKWRALSVAVNGVSGHKFKIAFTLPGATIAGFSYGDTKKGWFVDNITVAEVTSPEVCNDSLDNNGDGLTDCSDPTCAADAACNIEVCNDGVDNDKDDAIDCGDSDCTNSVYCAKPVTTWTMDCGSTGWSFTAAVANNVAWAIDATPATPAPVTGSCTLNFNNGTNYCISGNCGNSFQVPAGSATLTNAYDATAYKTGMTLRYWHYMDVEDPTGNGANADLAYVEVSTSNYSCQFGNFACPSQNNPYNAGTTSYAIPKTPLKTWAQSVIDLTAFAGKSFKLRYRFDAVDNTNNNHAGAFIDDVELFAW